ncbi:MAG: hypothetical protein ACFHXK_19835 [bacterium]
MKQWLMRKKDVVSHWAKRNGNDLYWFLIFLAMYPALRADVLFPHTWLAPLSSEYAVGVVDNPFSFWMLGLAVLMAIVTLGTQRLAGSFAVLAFMLVTVGVTEFGQAWPGISTAYVAIAFALFIYFVFVGSVRSLAFLVFVALLVLLQPVDALLAWPQLIVFVVAALVCTLVVETVRQNLPLMRQLGRNNVFALCRRTFMLWWPMLILIGIGLWISNQLTLLAEEALYAGKIVTPYCTVDVAEPDILACPGGRLELKADEVQDPWPYREAGDGPAMCLVWDQLGVEVPTEPQPEMFTCPVFPTPDGVLPLTRLTFFESLDLSVERSYAISEWQLQRAIRAARRKSVAQTNAARDTAKSIFDVVPQTTGMETSDCDFFGLSCHAANIVINGLNAAYIDARADSEAKFIDKMQDVAEDVNGDIVAFTDAAELEVGEILLEYETLTRTAINRVHTASNVLRQIMLLWLIVIAIKSFMFVFARVIFDKSTDIEVDLLEHEGPATQGKVKSLQEVHIPGSYPFDVYYKANYQPLGPAPRFSIPQWRSSLMSRLRFGAWNMSQVKMPLAEPEGLTFNAIEAEHLVDWEMQEGEEVVFSYRHFVAMNENIQLRTVVSLRVATLLLGRIVFHTARCEGGPGRLILRTRGKPATAAQVRQSIPAARLVAWNRYARFSVDSHLTPVDIFLNGFNLRRSGSETDADPQGILVVEADARDGGILVGTLRFARNFLLPV